MANTPALVPVFTGILQNQSAQLCDARALHAFMAVQRDFSNWIKGRIRKFVFAEGVDYLVAKSGERLPSGTKYSIDYHLTMDMAKELAMVENNLKGREIRRYFIDCEKRLGHGVPATLYRQALEAETREARSFALASAGSRAMLLRKAEKAELVETVELMREAVQLRLALGYRTSAIENSVAMQPK